MKGAVVFLIFCWFSAARSADFDTGKVLRLLTDGLTRSAKERGLIDQFLFQEVIDGFLQKLEKEKEFKIPEVVLDSDNRLDDIVIMQDLADYTFERDENLNEFKISNLTLPFRKIVITGKYEFKNLTIPDALTVYGKGNFEISFKGLRCFLRFRIKYSIASGKWDVQDIGMSGSLDGSKVNFENLMNGHPAGEFMNEMINDLLGIVIDLLESLMEGYKTFIMAFITKVVNDILGLNED